MHAVPKRLAGSAGEMVASIEPRECPKPPGQRREVVKVDIPAVAAVFEEVVHRGLSVVGDLGAVDRGGQHAITSVSAERAGQSAPRRRAARSPEAAPSS